MKVCSATEEEGTWILRIRGVFQESSQPHLVPPDFHLSVNYKVQGDEMYHPN